MPAKVYLSGDIVRSSGYPDGITHDQRKARQRASGRCDYNRHPAHCELIQEKARAGLFTFKNDWGKVGKTGSCFNTCPFAGSKECPARKALHKAQKTFKIDYKAYRKLVVGAVKSLHESQHKLIFLTLTFGKWKGQPITEQQANICFSKFAENLKKTYSASHYIAVREGHSQHQPQMIPQKEQKRLHFHVLVSIPYVSFSKLQRAWNFATSEYCEPSRNSLTTAKGSRIVTTKNFAHAVKYLAKYFSKVRKDSRHIYNSRVLFVSHSALDAGKTLTNFELNQFLTGYNIEYHRINDYATIVKTDDWCRLIGDICAILYNYSEPVNMKYIKPPPA